MVCAYCGGLHPWTREWFPSRIYAVCWGCVIEHGAGKRHRGIERAREMSRGKRGLPPKTPDPEETQ